MKHIVFIPEGAADLPHGAMAPRTPLAAARARHAARLTVEGAAGVFKPDRDLLALRGELALAALLGVSAKERRWLSRGALEAAGEGIVLRTGDVAYRANFITLDGETLSDASVRLSADETSALVRPLQQACSDLDVDFHTTPGGRLLVVFHHAHSGFPTGTAPTVAEGGSIRRLLPGGKSNPRLRELHDRCARALASSSVNAVRLDLGENPANALWLWGGGPPVLIERPFAGEPLTGFCLSNSPMACGLARGCGMDVLHFRSGGETSSTSPVFDLPAVVDALRRHDLALVCVQAPREGARYGNFREKTMALEAIDFHILGPLLSVLESFRPFRILLSTDLPVGAASGKPEAGPVPFVLSGDGIAPDDARHWDEEACGAGRFGLQDLDALFPLLVGP